MPSLDFDAFADSQVLSKLWLCEELEGLSARLPLKPWIAVYGGWYGILPFLLFSRGKMPVAGIRSLDRDAEACHIANRINKAWEIDDSKFKAFARDCGALKPWPSELGPKPDLVINTACEHFESPSWWDDIEPGRTVALQSTDQVHPEHVACVGSVGEMKARYPMREIFYEGVREFRYPEREFRRFMLIGTRGP